MLPHASHTEPAELTRILAPYALDHGLDPVAVTRDFVSYVERNWTMFDGRPSAARFYVIEKELGADRVTLRERYGKFAGEVAGMGLRTPLDAFGIYVREDACDAAALGQQMASFARTLGCAGGYSGELFARLDPTDRECGNQAWQSTLASLGKVPAEPQARRATKPVPAKLSAAALKAALDGEGVPAGWHDVNLELSARLCIELGRPGEDIVEALVARPELLGGITRLDLGHSSIMPHTITAAQTATLVGRPELCNLVALRADLDVPTLNALKGSQHLAGVEELHLFKAYSSDYVLALAQSPWAASLKTYGGYLDNEGCEIIAKSSVLAGIDSLAVSYSNVGDRGLQALLDSPSSSSLRNLELRSNPITAAGLTALVNHPKARTVERLDLRGMDVLAVDAARIVAESPLQSLRELRLDAFESGQRPKAGYEALANWPGLARLERLELSNANLSGPDGLKLIQGLGAGLRELDLSVCWLSTDALLALVQGPAFPTLERLNVARSMDSDGRGLQALAESGLGNLKWLAYGIEYNLTATHRQAAKVLRTAMQGRAIQVQLGELDREK
jgi:hypothetical protein